MVSSASNERAKKAVHAAHLDHAPAPGGGASNSGKGSHVARGRGSAAEGTAPDAGARSRSHSQVPSVRTAWTLVTFGVVAFGLVYAWMMSGLSAGVDNAVHDAFVNNRQGWLNGPMLATSTIFGVAMGSAIILVVSAAFALAGHWRSGLLLIGAEATSTVVATALKITVDRSRPDSAFFLGPNETDGSFPSGHVISTATLVLVAGFLWWRLAPSRGRLTVWITVSVLLPVWVACSRLYLGVHYLSDTMASAALALAVCGVAMLVSRRWLRPVGPSHEVEGPHLESTPPEERDVA